MGPARILRVGNRNVTKVHGFHRKNNHCFLPSPPRLSFNEDADRFDSALLLDHSSGNQPRSFWESNRSGSLYEMRTAWLALTSMLPRRGSQTQVQRLNS